jgi:hypothetical protein
MSSTGKVEEHSGHSQRAVDIVGGIHSSISSVDEAALLTESSHVARQGSLDAGADGDMESLRLHPSTHQAKKLVASHRSNIDKSHLARGAAENSSSLEFPDDDTSIAKSMQSPQLGLADVPDVSGETLSLMRVLSHPEASVISSTGKVEQQAGQAQIAADIVDGIRFSISSVGEAALLTETPHVARQGSFDAGADGDIKSPPHDSKHQVKKLVVNHRTNRHQSRFVSVAAKDSSSLEPSENAESIVMSMRSPQEMSTPKAVVTMAPPAARVAPPHAPTAAAAVAPSIAQVAARSDWPVSKAWVWLIIILVALGCIGFVVGVCCQVFV